MERKASHISWFLLLIVSLLAYGATSQSQDDTKSYIVYLGDLPKGDIESPTSIHKDLLQQVTARNSTSKSLVRSFKRSFNGFVVNLTEEEMHKMAAMEGVVSVFPNEIRQLHTTRSWDFLSFPQTVKRATIESDTIVAVLDSGIWPESKSFDDTGYGPPPAKWKGVCQSSATFKCNKKIIGAKYYRSDRRFGKKNGVADVVSPRDTDGHGTHTASTAAGNLVNKASLFGIGEGTARGGVPAARIAVYKICWAKGCADADILAAFDDAIADGVDIISLSVGSNVSRSYFSNSISIGSFHAMKKGILTSISAGNNGPNYATTAADAPWGLSVAASTTDRRFVTRVRLGNGVTFTGRIINAFDIGNKAYPLIHGGDAPNRTTSEQIATSRWCFHGSLNRTLVKGKIVFCESNTNMTGARDAGAIGTLQYDAGSDYAAVSPLPASNFNITLYPVIGFYANSSINPTATIYKANEINDKLAPFVINFSSRGPNNNTHDILKPDLSAPGVEIVAAWSEYGPISGIEGDNRVAQYNIISGTSMACPHVTGAAAYVKTFNPTWSPAAIKSALMTTATPMSSALNPQAEFAYGSGNIDPIRALNPGLVYNASEVDYIKFLCGQGYSDYNMKLVTGDPIKCASVGKDTASNLNYPSLTLSVPSSTQSFSGAFNRVVTNVGPAASTYRATVSGAPAGLNIVVNPTVLKFTSTGQSLPFTVDVKGTITGQTKIMSASLVWDDGVHKVRAPIVVYRYPL